MLIPTDKAVLSQGIGRQGYTIIEVIEFIVAILIARMLAARVSAHGISKWPASVYWGGLLFGTLLLGFLFMSGSGCLLEWLQGRQDRNSSIPGDQPKVG